MRSIRKLSPHIARCLPLFAALLLALFAPPPAHAQKDLSLKLPASGDYLVWLSAETAAGTQAQPPARVTGDRATLSLSTPPPALTRWHVFVLDEKSGYVATKTVPAKSPPAEVSFATPEFNRVHRVRVQVTGAESKPVAGATVKLMPGTGATITRVIDATAGGTVEFSDVPSGSATLSVTTLEGAGSTSFAKSVDINLPKGEAVQTITVPLPEVKAVVDQPSSTAGGGPSAPTGTGAAATDSGSATAGGTTNEKKEEKTDTPASPAAPLTPAPAPSGGSGLGTLVGMIVVLGAGYLLYLKARNDGWTVDKALARLGVQPVTTAPAGAGPGSTAAPPPPAPPVDPNVCPFCGQRKDPATGTCACSLDTAPASLTAAAIPTPVGAASGSGPRLIAVSGVAMGQIYPVSGEAAIGRDPGNAISLAMDSTVSRRHAVIAPVNGGYTIRDQGSSNGTFVNGARVEEAPLRPGDEVSIGGTRFRFEV